MNFINTKKLLNPGETNWYTGTSALWTANPDHQLIVDLMRSEHDKLGFIPITSLLAQIDKKDCLIWQRDQHNRKIGYLIHTPITPHKPIHIWLTVIAIDRRRRLFATRALAELIRKAHKADAPYIRLRCAADLEANAFWQTSGFTHVMTVTPNRNQPRDINVYNLPQSHYNSIRQHLIIQIPYQFPMKKDPSPVSVAPALSPLRLRLRGPMTDGPKVRRATTPPAR